MSQKVTTGVRPTLRIADKNQIPATEPERQYYFMDIAKEYLRQLSEEKGSQMTFHVSTLQVAALDDPIGEVLSMKKTSERSDDRKKTCTAWCGRHDL